LEGYVSLFATLKVLHSKLVAVNPQTFIVIK